MGLFDKKPKEPFISSYQVLNKEIVCPVCSNTKFVAKEILLNTSAMTFFGLDWANRQASALVCTNCSRIEWYFNKPKLFGN